MQAITVKFLGPTNTRGPRWKATCAAASRTYDQADNLGRDANAACAAMQLCSELQWSGQWHGGVVASGDYVFVQPDDRSPDLAFKLKRVER